MPTTRTTQRKKVTEKQSTVANSATEAAERRAEEADARYEEALKRLDQMAVAMAAAGIKVEKPPTEITTVVEDSGTEFVGLDNPALNPSQLTPQQIASLKPGTERPWSKADLARDPEKFDFVPQFIPGAVHPILDENRRPKIWLQANGLNCCLTVGVLNKGISGIFYHLYMNIEEQWLKSEEFKNHGPVNGPWVTGGPHGANTWFYEPEAPKAWIDLDGRYYTPGAPMPSTETSETA